MVGSMVNRLNGLIGSMVDRRNSERLRGFSKVWMDRQTDGWTDGRTSAFLESLW